MSSPTENTTWGMAGEIAAVARAVVAVWTLISNRARVALLAATALMAVTAWMNARIPLVLGDLATAMTDATVRASPWTLRDTFPFLTWLSALFLMREALQVGRRFLVHNTVTRVEKRVTVMLVSHLLQMDLATLSRDRIGALHGRVRRSVEGFVKLLMLSFMDFIPAVITAAFAFAVAASRDIWIGSVMIGILPAAIIIVLAQIRSQKGIRLELLRSKEEVDGAVIEQLGAIECVRAANTQSQETARVEFVCETVRERELRHHVAMSFFDCGKALNEGGFFIAVVALSIGFASTGRIPVGDVVVYAMLFGSVLTPLRDIHRILDEAHESTLRVADLLALLAEPRDRSFDVTAGKRPATDGAVPILEMHQVGVQFEAADGKLVSALRNVDLQVRRGEVIGIAGPSGSGKSTLARVVLRLQHTSVGTVHIGGVPSDAVTRGDLAGVIGYVSQTPFLFAGTIRDNIAYERPDAAMEAIVEAAHLAGIHDEIVAMPAGYESVVRERGQNLSGGQRQRIALARVFLKNPAIILLDEATSALDNIGERRVQDALLRARAGRTIVLIAHRLSTLRIADRILVFEKGRLVQTGDYETLSSTPGVFSELVRGSLDGPASDTSPGAAPVLLGEVSA